MSGSDGLVSCVGGCDSKIFKSRRVHRPLVDNISQANIHLQAPPKPKSDEKRPRVYSRYRLINPSPTPLTIREVKGVKKSRKRRDRRISLDPAVSIENYFDDEETTKRSRPIAVQFMFWFCGILIVLLGVGALVYAIYLVSTSMDKLTSATGSHSTDNIKQMRKFSGQRIGKTAGNLAPVDTTFPP